MPPSSTSTSSASIPPPARTIKYGFYPSGHMIYFDVDALKQVKADLARFYDEAAPRS
jgi:carboxypeptidase C (cathepsin A)